jgi:hypothetical protein
MEILKGVERVANSSRNRGTMGSRGVGDEAPPVRGRPIGIVGSSVRSLWRWWRGGVVEKADQMSAVREVDPTKVAFIIPHLTIPTSPIIVVGVATPWLNAIIRHRAVPAIAIGSMAVRKSESARWTFGLPIIVGMKVGVKLECRGESHHGDRWR